MTASTYARSSAVRAILLVLPAILAITRSEDHCEINGHADCELTPEETEGPYFIPGNVFRSDIREGSPGIRLELQLRFQFTETCKPIPNLYIHIWNANAIGEYSGGQDNPPRGARGLPHDSLRFFRGVQKTDETGVVNFTTIIPGWYGGRTVHIHVESFKDQDDADVKGVHTTQLYFDEDLIKAIAKESAYKDNQVVRLSNSEDHIFVDSNGTALILKAEKNGKDMNQGVFATFVLSVKSWK